MQLLIAATVSAVLNWCQVVDNVVAVGCWLLAVCGCWLLAVDNNLDMLVPYHFNIAEILGIKELEGQYRITYACHMTTERRTWVRHC